MTDRAKVYVYLTPEDYDFIYKFAKENGGLSMSAAVCQLVSIARRSSCGYKTLPQPIVPE